MPDTLIEKRENLMDRAESALGFVRSGSEDACVETLVSITEELKLVAEAMKRNGYPPVERCKTERYLGMVFSDLRRFRGIGILAESLAAYQRAELLLEGSDEPLEKARLDFNWANTLTWMGPDNTPLLKEAVRRYLMAKEVFRKLAPKHLDHLESSLALVRGILSIKDQQESVARVLAGLERIRACLIRGMEPSEARKQLLDLKRLSNSLIAGLSSIRLGLTRVPETATKMPGLKEQLDGLMRLAQQSVGAPDPFVAMTISLLRDRILSDVERKLITPAQAEAPMELLARLETRMRSAGDDFDGLAEAVSFMNRINEMFLETCHYLGHGLARPPQGTRAAKLIELCWSVRRPLHAEVLIMGKGRRDDRAVSDLLVRSASVDRSIYEAGGDDEVAWLVQREKLLPFALEARAFASRRYAMLAFPDWPRPPVVRPMGIFYSGSAQIGSLVESACRGLKLELLRPPPAQDLWTARLQTLREAAVTVFHPPTEDGPLQASVAYEMGIARTLGKPMVILTSPGDIARIFFDSDTIPTLLEGDASGWEPIVKEAIDSALVWTAPNPALSGVDRTIGYVMERYKAEVKGEVTTILDQLAQDENAADATAAISWLEQLVKSVQGPQPILIFPPWVPFYPAPGVQRLFHVTKFGEGWPAEVKAKVRNICQNTKANDSENVEYVRGDDVAEPMIIRSIWEEICRATHILVDITGLNRNVAYELGIAHTLGRPVKIIGQGITKKAPDDKNTMETVPMLAKFRAHPYQNAEDPALAESVMDLLRGR